MLQNTEPFPNSRVTESMTGKKILQVLYHMKCRSVFTTKQDLVALKRKAVSNPSDDAIATSSAKKQARRSSSESCIYTQDCTFCGKIKCHNGTSTREKVRKAVDLREYKTLRDCAVRKCHTKIISVTSRDMVAAEAQYQAQKTYNTETQRTEATFMKHMKSC